MKWTDSLREAICRRCEHNGSDCFTREQLIQWELETIIRETGSTGKTPQQTLSRELQRLRYLGEIEFLDDRGNYRNITLGEVIALRQRIAKVMPKKVEVRKDDPNIHNSQYFLRTSKISRRVPVKTGTNRRSVTLDSRLKVEVESHLDRKKGETFSGLVGELLKNWVDEVRSETVPGLEEPMRGPDVTTLVSETTWHAWCQTLKAGEPKGMLVSEIASEIGLSWPFSRRSESLDNYLDLTLAKIEAIPGIGRKKLRTIVLCVAQAVHELRSTRAPIPDDECKNENINRDDLGKHAPSHRSTRALAGEFLQKWVLEELMRCPDVITLVSETTWHAWRQTLKAGEPKGMLVSEIASEIGLSWPFSRRSESLDSYLDLTLAKIEAIPGIGRKKLRTIVLCVAQAVHELRSTRAPIPDDECKNKNINRDDFGQACTVASIDPSTCRRATEPPQGK